MSRQGGSKLERNRQAQRRTIVTDSLRVVAWNHGFASRKPQFRPDDRDRASGFLYTLNQTKPNIGLFQELANRRYANGTSFSLAEFYVQHEPGIYFHFEAALVLPD